MSSINERGVPQPERFTRRELFRRTAGLAAAALALAGCDKVELPPQTTGREGNDRPRTVSEPQIDEGSARDLSVLYMLALGAGLFFLRRIR